MQTTRPAVNPFGLLMNPQDVMRAVEASENLRGLNRQVCRPLDKPMGARSATGTAEFDQQVEEGDDLSDPASPAASD